MKQKYLSSGIQKKYLKSTLILLLLALLLSMIGVWSYMHHTLKNNIIEKYEFADEKMGILLDNLYTKSKEVTAEAILNETIQKSLNAEELTDNEKNAVGKYFSYLDLDSIQDYCYMDNKTSVYKGYKQDKIEMRGDRAEMSDFPLYLNTVAGGLDRRDQTIGGFSFVVKIYTVPVVEIIG